MLPPFYVFFTYGTLLMLTPIIVTSTCGSDILQRITYHLNLHYRLNKIEPIILCVGLITFYNHVLFGFMVDMAQAFQSNVNTLSNRARYTQFENAHNQLREMFPPFVVSSFLIYANTTRFDTFRNSFIALQTVILLVQPIASMSSRPNPGHICKYFFRSVLCWTLLYALFPRETAHSIQSVIDGVQIVLGKNNNYYSHRLNNGYGNIQQWIL